MEQVYLSREGLEKLKKDLEHLVKVVRPEAVVKLAEAREHGDLSENAEYDAARENIREIDRRIVELQRSLSRVHIVENDKVSKDEVRILCRVTLLNVEKGIQVDYTLVDPLQTDPSKRLISVKSPIGKGLLGKKVGDEAVIKTPSGNIHLKVLAIERTTGL